MSGATFLPMKKRTTKRVTIGATLGAVTIAAASFFGVRATKPPATPVAITFGDSNAGLIGQGITDDGRWDVKEGWKGQCSLLGGSHTTPDDSGTDSPASYKAVGCAQGEVWRNQLLYAVNQYTPKYVVVNVGAIDALARDGAPGAPGPEWQQAVRDIASIGSSQGGHVIWVNLGKFYPNDQGLTKNLLSRRPCNTYFQTDFASDGLTSWTDAKVQALNASTASAGATGLDIRDLYSWSPTRDDCLHYISNYDAIGTWVVDHTP